ncbi:MAG: 2-phosphosulfolactate phosphatase, partial [Planctomycetaceae bacterium]|nr:2-phosphosulfolactate phosphatase [Planctomycetaceae bacterium]
DLGNSPQLFTPEKIAGKILILTTTNGTVAMHAARKARTRYAAALLNAQAVVEQLITEPLINEQLTTERHQTGTDIAIFCAGTDGVVTEEDLLLAGCLVSRLSRQGQCQWNSHAETAKQLWENRFCTGNRESISEFALIEFLRQSRGGKNLIELGFDADIEAAARIDSINIVPEFRQLPP